MNHNGFKKGSGCFACSSCGKLTRNTGDNEAVCPLCYEKGGCENALSDAGYEGDVEAVFADCKTPDECYAVLNEELDKLAIK